MKFSAWRGIAFLGLATISACATLSRGQSEVDALPLSENYKKFRSSRRSLYIQNFENRTYSPQLTGRLKEKLQYAFTRRPSLTVTPEKKNADLILYGKILIYAEEPGVYDRYSQPLTYNLTMVASVKIRVSKNAQRSEGHGGPRVPGAKDGVSGTDVSAADEADLDPMSEEITVRYMTSYNKGEPFFEQRFTAEERMLDGLADRIVNSTYEPENMEVRGSRGTGSASVREPPEGEK